MLNRLFVRVVLAVAATIVLASAASASILTFTTSPGATAGGVPVSASVTFTTEANRVTILLENLLPDPASVGQCISGLSFTMDTGEAVASLLSGEGLLRTVAGDGTFSDGGVSDADWSFGMSGGVFALSALGSGPPHHTIIGPANGSGLYGSGNSSIGGNAPHNPFLAQSALFVLEVPGMTSESGIETVVLGFGTAGTQHSVVPEPGALLLLALGGVGVLVRRRQAGGR